MNAETESTSKPPLALWRSNQVIRAGEIRGVMIDAVSAVSADGSEHLYTMTMSMTKGYEPKVGNFLVQFAEGETTVTTVLPRSKDPARIPDWLARYMAGAA